MKDTEIWDLFGGRCVVCRQHATELNHITPRSADRSMINDWKNKVPMCRKHHDEFHLDGVTDDKVIALRAARARFLFSIGKGEYI